MAKKKKSKPKIQLEAAAVPSKRRKLKIVVIVFILFMICGSFDMGKRTPLEHLDRLFKTRMFQSTHDKVSGAFSDLWDYLAIEDIADDISDKASDTVDSVKDAASNVMNKASDNVRGRTDKAIEDASNRSSKSKALRGKKAEPNISKKDLEALEKILESESKK